MTKETHIIIAPEGPQGSKLALEFANQDQFVKFDEAIGELSEVERKSLLSISEVATKLGIREVKP